MSTLREKLTSAGYIQRYCPGGGKPMLVSRPEFYSGRGVTRSDLNERHLVAIYEGLVQDEGQEVADQFVAMVESLADLSATNFLTEWERFYYAGFTWREASAVTKIDVGPDTGDGTREAVAMVSIASVFGNSQSSSEAKRTTEGIRRSFLHLIGKKTESPASSILEDDGRFYTFG